jgi:hypothetical protein
MRLLRHPSVVVLLDGTLLLQCDLRAAQVAMSIMLVSSNIHRAAGMIATATTDLYSIQLRFEPTSIGRGSTNSSVAAG